MLFSLLALISGAIGLAYELIYQRAFSLINGDLYLTYALIILTFIIGSALGNLMGFRLRRYLPLLEIAGGIFAMILAIFLRTGGYQVVLPTPVLIILISLPAFIVGTSIPLYAYYLHQFSFTKVYFLYHLGALAWLLSLESLILPYFPLSFVLSGLGIAQIILGLVVYYFFRQRIFILPSITSPWNKLWQLVSLHWPLLLSVFLTSALSYYYHFSQLRVLYFYQFLVRPAAAYLIIVSIFFVAAGTYLSRRLNWKLPTINLLFVLHQLLTIYALPFFAGVLTLIPYPNLQLYLLLLDVFALAPLIWATVFFCQALNLAGPNKKQTDIWAGGFLAASAFGNLAGFTLALTNGHLINQWGWGYPVLVLAGAIIYLSLKNKRLIYFAALILALAIFTFNYDLTASLNTGLDIKLFLQNRLNSIADLPESFASWQRQNYYRLTQLSPKFASLVGTADYYRAGQNSNSSYIVDGYVSHELLGLRETLVGLVPRRYFSQKLDSSLVIGLGTGQTTSGVAMISDQVTAVDINPAVFDFLPRLSDLNHDLTNNPRVQLIVADGMTYLKQNSKRYQLILNTATNLYTHGVAKLNTQEFLNLVQAHLTPDGIYLSWIDINAIRTLDDLRQVVALHQTAFAHLDLHLLSSGYALLVSYSRARAGLEPITVDSQDLAYLQAHDLTLTPPSVVWQLENHFPAYKNPTPVSTMDLPRLETLALKNYLTANSAPPLDFTNLLIYNNTADTSASGQPDD